MATALIIEDEYLAVQHLTRLLAEVAPEVQVLGLLQSVEESVEWFKSPAERGEGCTTPPLSSSSSPMPDMVFMDIHLADGLAFRIFEQVEVPCPIIFTTAYDQYALQAFQVNSIDYLLKPISAADLRRALDKLGSRAAPPATDDALHRAIEMLDRHYHQYKRYFLIPLRDKLVPIDVRDIACIYIDNSNPSGHSASIALMMDGTTHPLSGPLDIIMGQLDPSAFFRANRQYIVAHRAIKDISVWLLGKYMLTLTAPTPDRIIIPKARIGQFKQWYTDAWSEN